MRALRASLGQREPRYSGEHFDFSDITVSPAAVQRRVPLWVGGRSLRSLRRATGLGDGWVPFGLDHDAIAGMLARVDVPNGFEVVLSTGAPLDPMADPTACHAALDSVPGSAPPSRPRRSQRAVPSTIASRSRRWPSSAAMPASTSGECRLIVTGRRRGPLAPRPAVAAPLAARRG